MYEKDIRSQLSIAALARYVYPSSGSKAFIKRLSFYWRAIKHYRHFTKLYSLLSKPALSFLTERYPRFYEKLFRPHIASNYTVEERTKALLEHFNFMEAYFELSDINQFYSERGKVIFTLPDGCFTLVLHYLDQFECEGNCLISLLDKRFQRFYSVALSFQAVDHSLGIVIGAIQGPPIQNEERMQQIKSFTRAYHGLRPRSFMIEAMQLFAQAMGASRMVAVTNHSHIANGRSRRSKKQIVCDYNQLWQEYAVQSFDTSFVEIPLQTARKSLQVVKSKKRAMYRRRYDLLDSLKSHIFLLFNR